MKRKDENRIFRSAMLRRFIWISAVLSLLILILAVSIMLLLETEVLHFLPALALMAFLCFLICCMFIAASLSFFRRLSELLSGIRRLAEGEPVHMYEEGIISELAKGLNQASEIQTRQKRMLEKRDDLRIEWIRGVSHDIRTPLSVALGYAEELEEDEDLTEEQRQEASLIKEQTLRIRELIEDLNLLSRLEYDSHPLRLRETAAAGLIRNAAAEMMNGQSILRDGREESVTMADFDMELMLLPEFERLSLKVDPALIRRVLRNIKELIDDVDARITVEAGRITQSVTEMYEAQQHNYAIDGSFSGTVDTNWYRSNTSYVYKTTWKNRSCICINLGDTTSTSYYVRTRAALKVPKTGKFTIRMKACCGKAGTRLRCSFGSSVYTTAGQIGTEWGTIELTINSVSAGSKYLYLYCYTAGDYVCVTDIEILGYASHYNEAQIEVLADSITTTVKQNEFASYVTQYYDRVITAFNNSSKYVQITAGAISIYDGSVTTSKRRATFNENGNHFYRDGYYVGKIGTNQLQSDNSKKGLNFDLEDDAAYMTWAAKDSASATVYTMKLTYVQKGKGWGNYTAGELHAGANLDMHGWTLKNPSFEGGGITGTLNFVQPISMNSDGTVARWSNGAQLQFQNGILIYGRWYGG